VFLVRRHVSHGASSAATSPLRFFWKAMAGSLPAPNH
jgi:hypothetical protein